MLDKIMASNEIRYKISEKKSNEAFVESVKDYLYMENILNDLKDTLPDDEYTQVLEFNYQKFKQGFSDAMRAIYNALVKFFEEVKMRVEIEIQKRELNKKLDILKNTLAKKRSKLLNGKFDYFDVGKYREYYTDFINAYTAELKKGLNKEFKSEEEYLRWKSQVENKLDDFNYKMSDMEQWKLSIAVNNAINLTDKELKNRQNNLAMVRKTGITSLKDLDAFGKKFEKKLTIESSYINFEPDRLTFIQSIGVKIGNAIRNAVKFISKHPFLTITALVVMICA